MKRKIFKAIMLVLVLTMVAALLPACGPSATRVKDPQDGGEIEAFCAIKSQDVFGELKGAYTPNGDFGFVTAILADGIIFCKMSREGDPSGEIMLAPSTALTYVDPDNYPEYLQLKGVGVVETAIVDLQKNWEKWVLGGIGIVTFVFIGNKVVGVVKGLRGASVADDVARVALTEYGDDAVRVLAHGVSNLGDEGALALRGLVPHADDVGHLATMAGYENADDLARALGFGGADDLASVFANNSDEAARALGAEADDIARLGRNQLSAVRIGHRSGMVSRFARAEEKHLSWQAFPVQQTRFSRTSIKFCGFEMVRETGSASFYYMVYPEVSLTEMVLAEGDNAVEGLFRMGEGAWTATDDVAKGGFRVFKPTGAPVATATSDDVVRAAAPDLDYIRLPAALGEASMTGGQVVRGVAPGAESLNILRTIAGEAPKAAEGSMFLVPVP